MSDQRAVGILPVDEFDVALLDLDGVIYIGPHLVDHADGAIALARERGMRFGFVTNNASRTPEDVAAHLCELGIGASVDDVVTSSQAGAHVLAQRLDADTAVLAVGGPGVDAALLEFGLRPVRSLEAQPAAVMQGFGRDVQWRDLADASVAVRRGAYWVATNLDATLPIPGGRAPGNGMLVAAVAQAAGRGPDAVAGKPHAPLMRDSIDRLQARRPLVVGDRLDTDIEGADRLGIPSLLVMTGVTDVATAMSAPAGQRPTLLARDLRGLLERHPSIDGDGRGCWSARSSRARVEEGAVVVRVGRGNDGWIDALRCACAASWATPDADIGGAVRVLSSGMP